MNVLFAQDYIVFRSFLVYIRGIEISVVMANTALADNAAYALVGTHFIVTSCY